MNIIVLGDSIAWGAFDKEKGGWVERLKTFLFNYDCFVYNCSVSGDTSTDVLFRMHNELMARKDDEEGTGIIIAIGANDCGFDNDGIPETTPEAFIDNIQKIYVRAKSFTNNILFVGLTGIDDKRTSPVHWDDNLNYGDESAREYNEELSKFCLRHKIPFADVVELDKNDTVDGCHPNEITHEKIFLLIKEYVKPWYE